MHEHATTSLAWLARRLVRWTAAMLLGLTVACGDEGSRAAERADKKEAAEAGETGKGAEAAEAGEAGDAAKENEGGTRVTLTEVAFANARIAVEPARVETGAASAGGLAVPGQVEFDPARVALISPRTAGRIERLLVVPGDRVASGQPVASL